MENNRKVICAGCECTFTITKTFFYRRKRWCGNHLCKDIIDVKVKHSNYKKAQKKIEKGTFRHGVRGQLREEIRNRDSNVCKNCFNSFDGVGLQVHHIIPVSNGGSDDYENLILLCHDCHKNVHQKGWNEYTEQFFAYTKSFTQ